MERETIKHESFGQLIFSRVSSNPPQSFYGSELDQTHYIQMTLSESEVNRDLGRDWYYASKMLARIRMTSGQFAELITSLNQGGGVPVTIEFLEKPIDRLPIQESRKEFVHRKFEDRMKEFSKRIKVSQAKAKEIIKKKSLTKQDSEDLTKEIDYLTQEIESNIPFFSKCFQETVDEVVFEAKTEVENAIQHKISVLGLNALHEQNKLLAN